MSEFADRNRRVFAERCHWPAGVLEECERLDGEHPGWMVDWLGENRIHGWERPGGYAARWLGHETLVGGDTLRRNPEDGVRRTPVAFGATVAELKQAMAGLESRMAAERADEDRLWAAMRRGLV